MNNRRALISAPSRDVLSKDYQSSPNIPSPIDPEMRINHKMGEAIGNPERYLPPAYSLFNTMVSKFDVLLTVWWPSESPWQKVHAPMFRSEIPQQYAHMPRGEQTPGIYDRFNIRQPSSLSQGGLQVLAEESP